MQGIVYFIAGALFSGVGAWLLFKSRIAGEAARLKGEWEGKIAEARVRLEVERASASEKLQLLQDAQAKLAESFKALSSDALKSNNQSFLDLAKTTLEKFQESAKGDLEKRQTAITD